MGGDGLVVRNLSFILFLAVLLLGGWFFIFCAILFAVPLAWILYQLRVQDYYAKSLLIDRFKRKLGLRATVKVATFDFLDDWEHGALTAHNITLHNPEGYSDSTMATMEFVKVEFLPFTWFTPCLEIRRITIQGIDAYLERVGGKLNTSAVALKSGEEPVGGVIVVWSDNSDETDSSEDDADVREGSGLQLGKVGRTAAGVAVQVATAMPLAAVNMAGSAVKRGIRSVVSKQNIRGLISRGRGVMNKKKSVEFIEENDSFESRETNSITDQDDESVRSPLSSLSPTTPTALPSAPATSFGSAIVEDMRGCDGLGMRELEEMWLTESEFGPGCGEENGSGTESCSTGKQNLGVGDGKGRLGKMYMMLKKKGSSFTVKRSKKLAGPREAEATSQAGAAGANVDTWQQNKSEGASPVEQVAAAEPNADGIVDKATIVVPHQTPAGAAECSSSRWGGSFRASSSERQPGPFERASSSSGLSKYSEKLGNLSRKAMRTIRHQALTETPYEEHPGQRFANVQKFVISNVRLHVSKLLNAEQQQQQDNQDESGIEPTAQDSLHPKIDPQPLLLSYMAIEAEDFRPCSTAIRQEGIPPKELARRIKVKVRGALRRQNRSAMLRLGAARGMEWLRTRVGKKMKSNKETKRHSSATLHDQINFVKAADLERRGSQESDVSVNVPWL